MSSSKTMLVARLALLIFSTSLFFASCSNDKQPRFADDIKKHFGDMNYREVIFSGEGGFNPDSDVQSTKGKGVVEGKSAKPVNHSWYLITDANGEIGGFYLGSDHSNTVGAVELTRTETAERLRHCKTRGDEENACLAQLLTEVWIDCIAASTPEECQTHCWMEGGSCIE